ncbi:MAG TPA: DRTGG domain-containing protein [Bacilli bacterium]|nr:DRTGG domain-containing protein [Bacilli bacterium]
MSTKHEQILQYIEELDVGSKISVRQIAKGMDVSEGTAYRAIKEAETRGIVTTIERVGTVRIEQPQKKQIEKLTYAEVVNIVEGTVLGGAAGLHKTLNKFVIGAMKLDAMMRYVDQNALLIVGNREQVHQATLQQGAAVLITGGFDTNADVKKLADELELPVISSAYDTFTVATLINRAIYDRMIKKDILLVEDVLATQKQPIIMSQSDTVGDWHRLVEETRHTRFPVVDEAGCLRGIITSKDLNGVPNETPVGDLMTESPFTVTGRTAVASAAHIMVWEGVELLPVVEGGKLVGVVSRQDVIRALQYNQNQPQLGQTIHDMILGHFHEERRHGEDEKDIRLSGEVTPQMTNQTGAVSSGVLMTLLQEAAARAIRKQHHAEMTVENVTVYFLKPVHLDAPLTLHAHVLDVGRKSGMIDVELFSGADKVGKALLTVGVLER